MKCKYCKRELPENALFCCWCGEKQIKEKKKKDEISVPAPIKRGNKYFIRLRAEKWSYTGDTADECIIKAKAVRAGFLENKKTAPKTTVKASIDNFINDNSNILSPATIRAYKSYYRNHLKDIADVDINAVNWQKWANIKAKEKSPKTVKNIWRLVTAAMKYAEMDVPNIKLPTAVVTDEPFLDFEQIKTFMEAVKGKEVELASLLALHSLRRSEILALTPSSIDRGKNIIHVKGSRVQGENNRLVAKSANKTSKSTRDIPIMIPRILELAPKSGESYLINCHPNRISEKINTVCRHSGLPEVGAHGLRRSFASLAYHLKWDERTVMLVGGWSNIQTVHKYYIKLATSDISDQTKSMKDFFSK